MSWWTVGLSVVTLSLAQAGTPPESPRAVHPDSAPFCEGEYADSFSALSAQARAYEQSTRKYTYCVRSTATYECLSYGPEGNVRRSRTQVSAHGTAFAYRQQGGETLLLTNEHVTEWPAVTDEAHPVEGVAPGCKRVGDGLRIVDNESDAFERDDIPLSRVVSDPQLDMSIIKTKSPLAVMPWKVGRSASLRERTVVDVRGFPLGVFNATNVGKVISAFDHDEYKDWNHDDFVVDALLSPGNSGSPVLAISCKTGEFELVGVYHAGYSRGSALNVVVGIDQVRDLMTTLRRSTRRASEENAPLDASARERMAKRVEATATPFFPFGNRTAAVYPRMDGSLLFAIYGQDFPRKVYPLVVLEDLKARVPGVFGEPGRVWFGGERGLRESLRAEQDAELQQQLARLLDALRRDATLAFSFQEALPSSAESRQTFDATARMQKALDRSINAHRDLSDTAAELADHLAPKPSDAATLAETLLTLPRPPPAGVGIHLGEGPLSPPRAPRAPASATQREARSDSAPPRPVAR
ncbi:hypothetical protein DRW03_33765 [Corallococcus sp. H22C18031201]|nr:hypothetical protein DRW03_33765 [Corallococcus sp. H22C18031201]